MRRRDAIRRPGPVPACDELHDPTGSRPSVRQVLVLNEPNLIDQANHTPAQAAAIWPRFEAIAARAGVAIVGPAITWGTLPGWEDPVVWLDAFLEAYRAARGGRAPRILTPDAQRAQMTELVATCERRADVARYAWFTGRRSPDPHHNSLLVGDGELSALGRHYLSLGAGGAR